MFVESSYLNRGKKYLEYLVTRDGFSLLAMGFTGTKALKWKIKYIEAFNKMEEMLRKQSAPTGKQLMAMALIEANETIENQIVLIDNLQKKVIEDEPKVSYVKMLQKGEDVSQISDFKKMICNEGFKIGQNVSPVDFQIELLQVQI